MTNTPPALKWLAEKRARIANDTLQTGRMLEELGARHIRLKSQLSALDETIRLYDAAIDPTAIAPVNGWQGRYGKRGVLRDALIDILSECAPDWVGSLSIEMLLIARFGISFDSPAQRKRWRTNCLCSALNRLLKEGTAERQQDPDAPAGSCLYWRLKQPKTSRLADL